MNVYQISSYKLEARGHSTLFGNEETVLFWLGKEISQSLAFTCAFSDKTRNEEKGDRIGHKVICILCTVLCTES